MAAAKIGWVEFVDTVLPPVDIDKVALVTLDGYIVRNNINANNKVYIFAVIHDIISMAILIDPETLLWAESSHCVNTTIMMDNCKPAYPLSTGHRDKILRLVKTRILEVE